MKRFWLVLLSLGLVMAFSASAFAVDVKVSGSYYAAGVYLDKSYLDEERTADEGQSTAFFFQRLRVGAELVVAPGLSLVTRFDAMERVWGGTRSNSATTTLQTNSAGTQFENENIAWDYAFVKYDSPIGQFRVGAMNGGTYGTVFSDGEEPRYRIKYYTPQYGIFSMTATLEKITDDSYTIVNTTGSVDADSTNYTLTFDFKGKNWVGGMLYNYGVDNTKRPSDNYKIRKHTFDPYFMGTFGPVKVQAEAKYDVGEWDYENATADKDINSFGAWIDAVATFGPVYVGGTFAYASGDQDDNDNDVRDTVNGGMDWSPTLIMWNEDRARWVGSINTKAGTAATIDGFNSTFGNAFLYQLRVGVKPVEKLDVCFSASYAQRDKTPDYYDDELGWEFDLTGTYKITNNLSYMLGAGYLITGDYFKGANEASEVENNYMIINKLALTF